VGLKQTLEVLARVLRALVGMMQQGPRSMHYVSDSMAT
jgi:hypothetical protein